MRPVRKTGKVVARSSQSGADAGPIETPTRFPARITSGNGSVCRKHHIGRVFHYTERFSRSPDGSIDSRFDIRTISGEPNIGFLWESETEAGSGEVELASNGGTMRAILLSQRRTLSFSARPHRYADIYIQDSGALFPFLIACDYGRFEIISSDETVVPGGSLPNPSGNPLTFEMAQVRLRQEQPSESFNVSGEFEDAAANTLRIAGLPDSLPIDLYRFGGASGGNALIFRYRSLGNGSEQSNAMFSSRKVKIEMTGVATVFLNFDTDNSVSIGGGLFAYRVDQIRIRVNNTIVAESRAGHVVAASASQLFAHSIVVEFGFEADIDEEFEITIEGDSRSSGSGGPASTAKINGVIEYEYGIDFNQSGPEPQPSDFVFDGDFHPGDSRDFPFEPKPTASYPEITGSVGGNVSITPTIEDGPATLTYSIASGSLPSGVSVDTGTGEISGQPTASGSGTVVIRAQNVSFQFDSDPIGWTIN